MENATNEMCRVALPVTFALPVRIERFEDFVKEFCDKDETYPHGFDMTFETGPKKLIMDFLAFDLEPFGVQRDSEIQSASEALMDTMGRAWIAFRSVLLKENDDVLPSGFVDYLFGYNNVEAICGI